MKFIHTADLHIDSPLLGLQQYQGAPFQRLRQATRDACENLVTLAIQQQAKLVIIAGDLFDGHWRDMQTGMWMAHQFRRLEQEHIDVYLLRGNHDAASRVRQCIRWPANVHEFPTDRPGSFILDDLGIALHGQGFSQREVPHDLVCGYPEPVSGLLNVGVLHTSLTGDPNHDTYAPTSEDILVGCGYHYWALGHIHARRVVRDRPYIAFSGNCQGRHIREAGAKGCFLANVADGEIESVEFLPTDTLRWQVADVLVGESDGTEDVLERVRLRLMGCREQAEGRFVAVRVVVRGACAAHQTLARKSERDQLVAGIRNLANELDEEVWIEKVQLQTEPLVDIDRLREGSDLVGELLRHVRLAGEDDDELLSLARAVWTLADKASVELKQAGVDMEDIQQLRGWLWQAEGLLVSQLLEAHG